MNKQIYRVHSLLARFLSRVNLKKVLAHIWKYFTKITVSFLMRGIFYMVCATIDYSYSVDWINHISIKSEPKFKWTITKPTFTFLFLFESTGLDFDDIFDKWFLIQRRHYLISYAASLETAKEIQLKSIPIEPKEESISFLESTSYIYMVFYLNWAFLNGPRGGSMYELRTLIKYQSYYRYASQVSQSKWIWCVSAVSNILSFNSHILMIKVNPWARVTHWTYFWVLFVHDTFSYLGERWPRKIIFALARRHSHF
jgi:hypothetical protein